MKTAFCFDMDGTVTSEEVLPILAKEIALFEEMDILTKATMDGILPFDKSFKLRVKLLSTISISLVQDIVQKINLQESLVNFIQNNKENCFIITGNLDIWIEKLVKRIGCKIYSSQADYSGDKLRGIKKIINKGQIIEKIRKDYDRVVVIGDGMNDAPMFEKADIRVAYGGVHNPVETLIKLSNYVTYNQEGLCNILNTL
jgi:phosphoserine phosphatase